MMSVELAHSYILGCRVGRAVTYHPRVDQFWYRYTLMEEIVGNIEGTRQLFER
jgi:hypothetical protein